MGETVCDTAFGMASTRLLLRKFTDWKRLKMMAHRDAMIPPNGPRNGLKPVYLTPAELSRIVMLIEAGGQRNDTLDQGILRKVNLALGLPLSPSPEKEE